MTILSMQAIRALNRRTNGLQPVSPFKERGTQNGLSYGLGPAGYDVRCAQTVVLDPAPTAWQWFLILLHLRRPHRTFVLANTEEHFDIPNDLLVMVTDKSTWARRGLAVQHTVVDPGFQGWLTLELSNHGSDQLTVHAGDPIAQLIFHTLDEATEGPYRGKYWQQPARPVPPCLEGYHILSHLAREDWE